MFDKKLYLIVNRSGTPTFFFQEDITEQEMKRFVPSELLREAYENYRENKDIYVPQFTCKFKLQQSYSHLEIYDVTEIKTFEEIEKLVNKKELVYKLLR